MDRRTFIDGLALGILARPSVARAQPARKVYRIGILGSAFVTILAWHDDNHLDQLRRALEGKA